MKTQIEFNGVKFSEETLKRFKENQQNDNEGFNNEIWWIQASIENMLKLASYANHLQEDTMHCAVHLLEMRDFFEELKAR